MSWQEFMQKWTFDLHRRAYELKDQYSIQLKKCEEVRNNFKQRINVLESNNDDLRYENLKLKQNALKTNLSQFKTNKMYKFNGTYRKPNTWLTDAEEKAHVGDWVDDNLDLSVLDGSLDEQAKQLRYVLFDHFGSKDIWKADKVQNTFAKPSGLISNDFEGNCNDWFVFMYYVYDYVFGDDNKLYCVMGGLNLPDGWNQGNHAYCLWEHSNGQFYVIESAVGRTRPWNTYIQTSLDAFGSVPITHNFRYSRPVWVFNKKEVYHQVVF